MPPARLFYLMGASGTGKDSLLHYLRTHVDPRHRVKLPQRHITRPANAGGETHIAVKPDDFQRQAEAGAFALHWQSHGFHYGIGREIDDWLEAGFQVVINGSRHYLDKARRRYPAMQPVLIRVSHDALLQRLTQRGRETPEQIGHRLLRAEALDRGLPEEGLLIINNDGPLHEAGQTLLKLILSPSMEG